jgi:phosphoketolase
MTAIGPDCEISSHASQFQEVIQGAWAGLRTPVPPAADRLRSHINPETPGSIHEGGELGYALAVSFGAVMDNPNLVVTCIVGDGEAETGPTAA